MAQGSISELVIDVATFGWVVTALATAVALYFAYPNGTLRPLKVFFYLVGAAALWIGATEFALRNGWPLLADRPIRSLVTRPLMFLAHGYFLWAVCRRGLEKK